jgi:hypothetical protein
MTATTSARHRPPTPSESADELSPKTIPGAAAPQPVSLRRTVGARGDGWWTTHRGRIVRFGGWTITLLTLAGGLSLLWNLLFTGPANPDVWLEAPVIPPPASAPVESPAGAQVDATPTDAEVEPSDDSDASASPDDQASPGEPEGSDDDSSGRGSGRDDDSGDGDSGHDDSGNSRDDSSGHGSGGSGGGSESDGGSSGHGSGSRPDDDASRVVAP